MTPPPSGPGYEWIQLNQLPAVVCPCGKARRALMNVDDFPGTIHQTEISADARLHYHKRLIETYYFLQCAPETHIQLDDQVLPVTPGTCIMIRPRTRHRVIGRATVLIVVLPKFDPADEWFD